MDIKTEKGTDLLILSLARIARDAEKLKADLRASGDYDNLIERVEGALDNITIEIAEEVMVRNEGASLDACLCVVSDLAADYLG